MDLVKFLQSLGFKEYTTSFVENRIDEEVLPLLSDDDLKTLGVNALGDRRKILKAIANLGAVDVPKDEKQSEPLKAKPKPPAVKQQLERSASSGGERRQLSVLFCDLVGSTELSGQLDPEDLREIIRQYQDSVAGSISRYNGYLARFVGDGVLAYFGWPQAYEDQAERAVRSGLAAVAAVAEIDLMNGLELHARVGIATGEVVVGDIVGEASTETAAVVGKTPNLAARLESIAEPDQVVIGDATRQLVGDVFEYKDLGQQTLKGIDGPVRSWRVLTERAAESRFDAAHQGELARFIGREHELGLLRERWALAKKGEGQVVLLSGEAGIGKSRLSAALRDQIGDEPYFRLHYQCSGHHINTAFYPIIKRLEGAAGFSSEDTGDTKLNKLETLLAPTTDDIKAVVPYFVALLSLPGEERYGSLDLSPQQLRGQTIEALIEQIKILSLQKPVLFVMEDVQWIDPSTEDYLGEIMPRIIDQAVFMLITCRPSYSPPWTSHPHLTSVEVSRFGREHGAEIVRMAGGQELPQPIVERLVTRAEGVPLYIEELTRAVVEAGVSIDGRVTEDQIPATLQASLVARLDSLDDAKEIAQIGSIFGKEFSYDLLAAVAEKSDTEVNNALDRLVQSGMVFRRGLAPKSIYTFKQSLLQDAAYATILISSRRRLHASIMEILESQTDVDITEKAELLAHHAFHGENWGKAFTYSRDAGLKASKRSANREAAALLEQALACLKNLPDNKDNLELAIDTRYAARSAIQAFGEHKRVVEHLREAEKLASTLDDQSRLGWASAYLSQYLWWTGEHEDAKRLGKRALEIAPKTADLSLEAVANFFLGQGFFNAGDYNQAVSYLQKNEALLHGELALRRHGLTGLPAVLSRAWLAWSLCELGEFGEAMRYANKALSIAEEVDQPYSIATACLALGQIQMVQSGPALAMPTLEKALDICETWSLDVIFPMAAELLGLACAREGEFDRFLALLQKAEAKTTSSRIFDTPVSVTAPATGYLLAEKTKEASEFASSALELARERGFRGSEARILYLTGEIATLQNTPDFTNADKYYREALELAEELGIRPLVADCRFGLGTLYRQSGKQKDADEYCATAAAMFQEMEMLRQTEQKSEATA